MRWLLFPVLGPLLTGLVFAIAWWLWRGRKSGLAEGPSRWIAVVAGLIPLLGVASERLLGVPFLLPFEVPVHLMEGYMDYRFTIPLLLGIISLILLACPAHPRGGRGAATLSPRTPTSFGRRWWFVAPVVVAAVIVLITLISGIASQPDPVTGRYTMYFLDIGGQHGMGAGIYGWFYSIPCLILLGILLAIAVLDLYLISRPALDHNHIRDTQIRTVRTRNVLAVATGALLVHLGFVLESLAGTASVRFQFSTAGGTVQSWTTFAALGPTFFVAGGLALALGVGLWVSVCLSTMPVRQPATIMVTS